MASRSPAIITTSWDDGHPLDDRLAELLCKYHIEGTFYIPKTNAEHEVMGNNQLLSLAQKFEIGGHTVNHVRINHSSEILFEDEILGCYKWLTEILGEKPVSFCFPGGKYTPLAIEYCKKIGFQVIRSTELLNIGHETEYGLMPTTIQLYPHSRFTYVKHLSKRLRFSSLNLYLNLGAKTDLNKLVEVYTKKITQEGGCLHLWGHSWEIEEFGLWPRLEEVLRQLSGIREISYLQNRDVKNHILSL